MPTQSVPLSEVSYILSAHKVKRADVYVAAPGGYFMTWKQFSKLAKYPYTCDLAEDGLATDLVVLMDAGGYEPRLDITGQWNLYYCGRVLRRCWHKGRFTWEIVKDYAMWLGWPPGKNEVTCLYGGAPLDVIMGSERRKAEGGDTLASPDE